MEAATDVVVVGGAAAVVIGAARLRAGRSHRKIPAKGDTPGPRVGFDRRFSGG
jgi:hypothetical protein